MPIALVTALLAGSAAAESRNVVAHAEGFGEAPENTLPAIDNAFDA